MRRSKSLKVSQGHESILWKELLVNFTSFFFFSSSSVTFSFSSDTTKKRNAFTGTFFFLLLHLLLFPSKGKKKNQTYLLSQTLKFLTNVTNHFCSLFSSNLVKTSFDEISAFFWAKFVWTQNNRSPKVFQNGLATFVERWNYSKK